VFVSCIASCTLSTHLLLPLLLLLLPLLLLSLLGYYHYYYYYYEAISIVPRSHDAKNDLHTKNLNEDDKIG